MRNNDNFVVDIFLNESSKYHIQNDPLKKEAARSSMREE